MATVVVEHEFKRRVSATGLHAGVDSARWCMDLHRVRPGVHYLATDGFRCACVFDAPDAEAIRAALRAALISPKAVWAATIHPGPGCDEDGTPDIAASRVLAAVERSFARPVAFDDLSALVDQGASCLDLHQVRFLRSYFSLDRQRMLCLYEGPDVEAVRIVNRQVGLPFDSVWGAGVV
jgi:hypothetical protein